MPLTRDEIEKLTALVRESIGFNQERGDSVKVINAPFKVEPVDEDEVPLWKQPEVLDLLRAAAVPGRPGAGRAAIVLRPGPPGAEGGSRPRRAADGQQARRRGRRRRDRAGAGELPALRRAPRISAQLEGRAACQGQPGAPSPNIVRGWVNGEVA